MIEIYVSMFVYFFMAKNIVDFDISLEILLKPIVIVLEYCTLIICLYIILIEYIKKLSKNIKIFFPLKLDFSKIN